MTTKIKVLFPIFFCTLIILAGCGDKKSLNEYQTSDYEEKESPDKDLLSDSEEKESLDEYRLSDSEETESQDEYLLSDYGESEGTDYSYAVSCMRKEGKGGNDTSLYWEIEVKQDGNVIAKLRVEDFEHGAAFPAASEMVKECDVNFDGKNDILICLGHFGNQGAITWKCFLSSDSGFLHCKSFTDIANPAIDSDNQLIRSVWRNSAASHGWGLYRFIENEFVLTECLTEEGIEWKEDKPVFGWRDEILVNGEWQMRESFTEKDSDAETIKNKLYGPDSYWALGDEKWIALEPS